VRLREISLEDFRSYTHTNLTLTAGVTAFVGANGAGKTNILEAVHLLSRGESMRANGDADMLRWGASVAHIQALVARAEAERRVEVVLIGSSPGRRRGRRWLLDGAGKRADDVVGEAVVVAFFPEEVQLLGEAPGARRRYLDAMVNQVDRRHRAETREYQRVLEHRNALLRTLREEGGPAAETARSGELAFWNEALCRLAGSIAERRARTVDELREAFQEASRRFTKDLPLDIAYAAQTDAGSAAERAAEYERLVVEKGEREVWQATTLIGPHREDLAVRAEGRELGSFASRGEHRSAVLALKLAEAAWIRHRSGELPVFLLDDVLSELDPRRRDALVEALPNDAQVLVTAAFAAGIPPRLLRDAAVREVMPGRVA